LHHDIAEMESVETPAVLAYRAGDVITTISGAKAAGLEEVLIKSVLLSPHSWCPSLLLTNSNPQEPCV
jgi:hypothetical protein